MTTKTTAALLVLLLITLSAGCIDNNDHSTPYTKATPPPSPTPTHEPTTPVIIPTPVPTQKFTPFSAFEALSYFDLNEDGIINTNEKIAITDLYLRDMLTPDQMKAYLTLWCEPNYVPPLPTPITISEPDPIPNEYLLTSDNYYSYDAVDKVEGNVYDYLGGWDWNSDYQYEADGFDCSKMSAYLEFMLENSGYHCVIKCADIEGSESGHAWILVEFQQGWLAYECTGCYWVYPDEKTARSYEPYGYVVWNPSMYDAGVTYESIFDIQKDHSKYINGDEVFVQEWAWWVD